MQASPLVRENTAIHIFSKTNREHHLNTMQFFEQVRREPFQIYILRYNMTRDTIHVLHRKIQLTKGTLDPLLVGSVPRSGFVLDSTLRGDSDPVMPLFHSGSQ